MGLISPQHLQCLQENGRQWLDRQMTASRMEPVVKLFTPDAGRTWLVAAIHPYDPDRLLALCDMADGAPQICWTSFKAIKDWRGPLGRMVECDESFRANATLGAYADAARHAGIVIA